ncbi:tol-pal system protein [Lampropedia cohaerens]|uniref:Cell division coordinator CpoB n=1 Tax=Lampropedia cohaerens TaxID=1610491 RepID=A0A0U1PZV1_9BURK|nr:tol-pal system protein YbgF [Lampropedia cohaerens]KKW68006.1 tol-pal system protein [Lampropedia cohaerens]
MITPVLQSNSIYHRLAAVGLTAAAMLLPGAAHALFEDGEARRAILELRSRVDQLQLVDQNTASEIQQMRSSLLELQGQISTLRSEVATLRGQNEELAQQLRQAHERLRQFEPQPVEIDGLRFEAQPAEQQAFEAALELLRAGDFAAARDAFDAFIAQYPNSGYVPSAKFWLGNALYATREYQRAIDTFNSMLAQAPSHARAADAALAIANSQIELKNVAAARRTLQNLLKVYPNTSAATEAQERLSRLR